MSFRREATLYAMLFFQVLPFTDKNNAASFWCVNTLKVLTHLTTPRYLLSVHGKSSKKSMTDHVVSSRWAMLSFNFTVYRQKTTPQRRGVVFCRSTLKLGRKAWDTVSCGETTHSAMLFFEVLPLTNETKHDVFRCV